ncbi:uncharacterized protein [Pyxicephalus adspersus]|uniref:uncharacterized protein n=1 Tax=Pyxicephalus adspersus TaxID=30357 RepID=UPI003B5A114B
MLEMDRVEQLLATNEENLSMVDLEKVVQLLTQEVECHRELLTKHKTQLQELHTATNERTRSREQYVSLFVRILDIQEALEEEEKTQQQLQEVTQEMERLSGTSEPESSEILESRIKEMENIIAAHQEKEMKLKKETKHLRKILEKIKEELAETASEHQRVTEELHAAQTALSGHGGPGPSNMELLLDSCIREVKQLNVLPEKKRHKK